MVPLLLTLKVLSVLCVKILSLRHLEFNTIEIRDLNFSPFPERPKFPEQHKGHWPYVLLHYQKAVKNQVVTSFYNTLVLYNLQTVGFCFICWTIKNISFQKVYELVYKKSFGYWLIHLGYGLMSCPGHFILKLK